MPENVDETFEVRRLNSRTGVPLGKAASFLQFHGRQLVISGGDLSHPVIIDLARRPKVRFERKLLFLGPGRVMLQEYGEPSVLFQFPGTPLFSQIPQLERMKALYERITSSLSHEDQDEVHDPLGRCLIAGEKIEKKRMDVTARVWSGDLPGQMLTLTNQRVILFGASASELVTWKSASIGIVGLLLALFAVAAIADQGPVILPDWVVGMAILAFAVFVLVSYIGILIHLVKAVMLGEFATSLCTATVYAAELKEIQAGAIQTNEKGKRHLLISLPGSRYIECSFAGRRNKQDAALQEWLDALSEAIGALGIPILKTSDQGFQVQTATKIRITCPNCGHRAVTSKDNAGKKTKCPKCQNPLTIPKEILTRRSR